MKQIILSAIFILTSVIINAQTNDDLIELMKSDLKSNRKTIITETMNFTDAESKAFWPIYQEYEYELGKLADKRISMLKEFAENYDSLTNERTDELMKSYFNFLEDRLSLNKKYYKKYAQALSPTIAAKYMQVEQEIQLIIDLEQASVLPYFKKAAAEKK